MIKNLELYKENIDYALDKNDLSKLKDTSVLVTGANGMIGSCIIDILNELNEKNDFNIKIYALVRNNPLDRFLGYKNLTVITQDVTKPFDFKYKFDYIINGASNSHPKKFSEEPVETFTTNFLGMQNVLEYAKDNNAKCVLFISSGEIYGEPNPDIKAFTEDYIGKIDPINSRSSYPLGKISGENLCIDYSKEYNIKTVIVRPCHTYGPTQTDDDSRASSFFIRECLKGNDITLKSKGEQVRSYTYVVDSSIGILKALVNGEDQNAYNVSNNNSILSIADFANKIANLSNKEVRFEIPTDAEKNSYNPVTRSVLDGSKLESIGWTPCFGIDEGLKNTLNIMS